VRCLADAADGGIQAGAVAAGGEDANALDLLSHLTTLSDTRFIRGKLEIGYALLMPDDLTCRSRAVRDLVLLHEEQLRRFVATWRRAASSTDADSFGPSVTAALKSQLGLRLAKQTAPVNIYVVDHIERPSEN
jgi:hypothetical protein